MHIVPFSEARRSNSGGIPLFEDEARYAGELLADSVYGASTHPVDGRRSDYGGLDGGGEVVDREDDLVDITMQGRVGQGQEAREGGDIVISLGGEGRLAETLVELVVPLENARAAKMDPDYGVGGWTGGAEDAGEDGFGGGDVVG